MGGVATTVVGGVLPVWEACLLGLVQGLTEFLPVSSSGHLAVVQHFLSPLPAEQKVAFDVALHVGTLVAVLAYFRRDLLAMLGALVSRTRGWAWSWIWLLGLATLPAAVVGLALQERIEAAFDSLPAVGICFLVTGTLLFVASGIQGADRDESALGVVDALVVGCFQAFALFPGVSRSGSTIASGLFRRARGDVAARFSFLLAVPAIGGAVLLEGRALLALLPVAPAAVGAGVLVAAVSGVLAIAIVLRALRAAKLFYFAYYCWALGVAVLGWALLAGVR
jgi:undecaprenyl-diphosphatase